MIAVTRIIVSATPRNEHRHKSANLSRSPGTGAGGVLKNFFFSTGGLRPETQALILPFYIPFSTEMCPFQVPLLTIMDKSSWDSNAIFIIFCNFWTNSREGKPDLGLDQEQQLI